MSHSHNGYDDQGSSGNLKVAFFLNLAFTILEIIGGYWTNSIAVLTDAVHDAGDSASLGLAWYFEKLSRRGRTAQHTYGYKRFRLLGGLITGIVLIVGLGFILSKAVSRLMSPEPVNAPGMIGLAVLGIVFNGAAVLRARRGSSLTEKVVSWHLLEDTLGWAAVLIGAGVMTIWNVPAIDPILSISISILVLLNVGRNLKKVVKVFLQTTPESFDLECFERDARALPKVVSMHHTHSWSLDGESHVLSTHLVMMHDTTREEMVEAKRRVRAMLDRHEFVHMTIDTELEGEECASD